MTCFYVFQGLTTLLIAAIVAYIMRQQHKTDKDKLRYDLYDRRLKIFQGTMALFVRVLIQKEVINIEDINQFSRERAEATFLFEKDVTDYLSTINRNCLDLWGVTQVLKTEPEGKPRNAAAKQQKALLRWFRDQTEVLTSKFEKYLRFGS